MKKLNLLLLLAILFTTTYAQKSNVQNAEKALRKEKLSKAVKFIEEAYQNSSTSNDVKMYNYRGDIYFEIHSNENYNSLYDSLFNLLSIVSMYITGFFDKRHQPIVLVALEVIIIL